MHGSDYAGQDVTGWLAQEKHDGWRALWTGSELVTREGKRLAAPSWFTAGLPKVALDCELIAAGGITTPNRVNSLIRRKRGGWGELELVVFDAPGAEPFAMRHVRASSYFASSGLAPAPFARVANIWQVASIAALNAALVAIQERKGEGIIVREPTSAYVAGRVTTMLKVKQRFL